MVVYCDVDVIGVTMLVLAVVMVIVPWRFRSCNKKIDFNKKQKEKNPAGTYHCRCARRRYCCFDVVVVTLNQL
jgi:hypothetical protein